MKIIYKYSPLLFVFLSFGLQAQNTINTLPNSVDTKIKLLAGAFLKQTKTPGLSIAVSKNDTIIYSQGFGYANVEDKIPMKPAIRLRTASVAKIITATAIGKLVSENMLDLDVPIKKYVSYIDNKYENLTTRQLAGHTSGLEHRPNGNRYKKKQFDNIEETVTLMTSDLLFEPDTKYKYSTHAFNLIAAVIEGASGKQYMDYMNTEIFTPLGMTDTHAENIKTLTKDDAKLYYIKNNKLRNEKLTNGSYKIPGASFRSTPTDLVKMMQAYSNGFISKTTVKELFKSHQLKNGKATNVGIAWRTSIDAFNNIVIEHAGSWLGARTVIAYYPDKGLSIALMINARCNVLIEETAHMIAQTIRDTDAKESLLILENEKIAVTFNSQKGQQDYKGTINFKENEGLLETTHDGFLKTNPIYYLGNNNQYTLATSYGLLYLSLNNTEELEGKLFTYFNRQSVDPKEEKPIVVFKGLD